MNPFTMLLAAAFLAYGALQTFAADETKELKFENIPINSEIIFSLVIDYDLSFEKRVAASRYTLHDEVKAVHFAIDGKGKKTVEATLFRFDRMIKQNDLLNVVSTMNKRGFRPAKFEELLVFASEKSVDLDLDEDDLEVVALGTSTRLNGNTCSPKIVGAKFFSLIYLSWWQKGWEPEVHFLAVRK